MVSELEARYGRTFLELLNAPGKLFVKGGIRMPKTVYRCTFMFKGQVHTVDTRCGIADFSSGFWINDDFKFTRGSDCRYWIPSNCIRYVKKIVEGEDGDNNTD